MFDPLLGLNKPYNTCMHENDISTVPRPLSNFVIIVRGEDIHPAQRYILKKLIIIQAEFLSAEFFVLHKM
jgi:hypothetical protein